MSRHSKTNRAVKEGIEDYNRSDSDDDEMDEQQPDYSQEEWDMILDLAELFQISQHEASLALQAGQFEYETAVEHVVKMRELEAKKKQKHAKETPLKDAKVHKEQKEQKELKEPMEQRQQKEHETKQGEKGKLHPEVSCEQELQANGQFSFKQRKSSQRKSSVGEDLGRGQRKNSYVVEEIHTQHYNSEYPWVQCGKDALSKNINIVVVGHVDSGKSTLIGVLLKEIAMVDQRQLHRNEKESRQMGMQSFKHAWVTDSTEEERARGITIDIGVKKIMVGDRKIVFLDSPGHRDFIPNMITGAAQADYAILVIDVDNFDSTFIGGGQTKQHAYIVRSLGVHKLIVAMNKMDRIGWSQEKFVQVQTELHIYLLKIGFPHKSIIYCPTSAIYAENITKNRIRPMQTPTTLYDSSLFDLITQLQLPIRPIGKPFRMSITNCYESLGGKIKGVCMSGKIEGGTLKRDDKLIILPQNAQCLVKDILLGDEKAREATVGDYVQVQIKLIEEIHLNSIKAGSVLSSIKYCIPVAEKFVMEALALDLEVPVLRGTEVIIYIGANKCSARIVKINYIFNSSDGTIIKKNPKSIRSNDCAQIQVETKEKVCVQLFSNFKSFGRVIIRQKKSTLFVGTIKMIK